MTDVQKLHDVLAAAGAALAAKDYERAVDALTQAVTHAGLLLDREERREQLYTIFDRRSEAYAKLKHYEAAAGDGLQLCGLRPTVPIGYLRVAEALRAAKRPSEALGFLKRGSELCGNPLQIRLITRAVESDRRILQSTGEAEGPVKFEVPNPESLGASQFASPPRAKPDEPTPTSTPQKPVESPARDVAKSEPSGPGIAGLLPAALLVLGLATALSAPILVALPVVIGVIIAAHSFEAGVADRPTILFVPMSVWTSGLLTFAITWGSPFLSWLGAASADQ